jgi:hypothetical protein
MPPTGYIRAEGSDNGAVDRIATRTALRALRAAYGERLLVVYVPEIDVSATAAPNRAETVLLSACREAAIDCLSMRQAMLAERDGAHHLSQGFSNTSLGRGHLNETGHRLVGEAIWSFIDSQNRESGK